MDTETQLFINNLANRYIVSKDDSVFSSLYKTIASDIGLKLRSWETSTYLAENHDITDLFHDALLNSLTKLEKDGYGDFTKIFFRSLHNNYNSLLRRLKPRRRRELLDAFLKSDTGDKEISKLHANIDIEQDYIKLTELKTDADKRQLIDVLTKNTDPLTTAIINEYFNWSSSERLTPTAIGKKLGIHHEKVKRTLRKLAKRYDESQFGHIDSYLAV